jgi:hypothetical protein
VKRVDFIQSRKSVLTASTGTSVPVPKSRYEIEIMREDGKVIAECHTIHL